MTKKLHTNSLEKRALLVKVTIHQHNSNRPDEKATETVSDRHKVKRGSGKYVKATLPKHALAPIKRNLNDFRMASYSLTTPFEDGGWRLLPVKLYERHETAARNTSVKNEELRADLVENWDFYKQEARESLGDLYNENDYSKTAEAAGARFSVEVKYRPIPKSGHFVVDSGVKVNEELGKLMEEEHKVSLQNAMAEVRDRLLDSLVRLVEKMREPDRMGKGGGVKPPVFRDSIIGNIRELVEIVPALNITGNPNIEKARQAMEKDLAILEPQDLRDDKELRSATAKKAEEISKRLAGTF